MENRILKTGFIMNWEVSLQTENGIIANTILVTKETITNYCETGISAYLDHYTHLWKHGDPSPYFNQYYQSEQVKRDLQNENFIHGMVSKAGEIVGIFKLDLNRKHPEFFPGNTLFVEKLYLTKTATGSGLGSILMSQFCAWARQLERQGIWLETMRKGPARNFYLKYGFAYLGPTAVPYTEVLDDERDMWVMGLQL